MRRILVTMAAVLVLMSGCSSDGSDGTSGDGGRPCTEVYAEGAETSMEMTDPPCLDEEGDLLISGMADFKCSDGRTLIYNDEGWGYVGEPWHRHADGAEQVAPLAERDACSAA